VPDEFRLSRIIAECVDIVTFVPAWPFTVPYCSLVIREDTIPLTVIRVLVEIVLYIDGIVLQWKDEPHSGVYQGRYVPLGVEAFICNDDAVIAAALVHLDLEDLPLLFGIWSKAHIKRVWKERLVSQGKRMNIRNYTLAVNFFEIQDPEEYLKRNATFHKW